MNSIELFAGIGGFRIACENLKIKTIWANDLDKKAAKVYSGNWNDGSFNLGDIWTLIDKVPRHDLLTGGFPCQPFSSAGKKQGLRDPRGTLFQAIIEIIKKNEPKYFVLENVKRLLSMENGQHFATIIEALSSLGYLVEWRLLNALDFGLPQNRERIIIIGTKSLDNIFSYLLSNNDTNNITEKTFNKLSYHNTWMDITKHNKYFKNWGLAFNGKFISEDISIFSAAMRSVKLIEILEDNVHDSFFFQEDTLNRIKNSIKVDRYYNGVQIIYNQSGGARMGYTIFGTGGIAPTLTSSSSRHYERYLVGDKFRRLTNVEYARIQGFPDKHCNFVTPYDQYKLYGNAVPPPLVKWVINQIISNNVAKFSNRIKQTELFL
jgi:DNA (cytosine-5)-methyltransferase 1